MSTTAATDHLSAIWWLWLPLVALSFLSLASLLAPHWYETWVNPEAQGIELAQVVLLLCALAVALASLRPARQRAPRWVLAWVVLAAVCSFYVAGEEISWGQQFAGWETPAAWARINNQQETNLHNVSVWFDQFPRVVLGLAVGLCGIALPVIAVWRPALRHHRLSLLLPPLVGLPLATIAILVGIVWLFDSLRGQASLFIRPSEVQEFFFYGFVLLYLVVLRRRLLALAPKGALT